MKRKTITLTLLILSLLLGACGSSANSEENMISIVDKYQSATNEGDWELAATYLAEDVVIDLPQGSVTGRDVWLAAVTKEGGGVYEDVQSRRVDGNTVIVEMIVTGPDFKSPAIAEVVVEDGKIKRYTVTPP
jgi:hypothetical protein